METSKRLATTGICMALAALSCLGMPARVLAAADAPASAAAQPIQELDEIWVYGKSLTRRIADAEDEFFKLYNKRNKNEDYRITCGYLALERDSMIMTRTCVPAFLATRYDDVNRTYTSLGVGSSMCLSSPTDYRVQMPLGIDGGGYNSFLGCSSSYSSGYGSSMYSSIPNLPVVTQEDRYRFADNVRRVIRSDFRLLAGTMDLAVLYQEMAEVQSRYQKAREAQPDPHHRAPAKSGAGPRAL